MNPLSAKFKIGEDVPTRDSVCDQHGQFKSSFLLNHWSACPACFKEAGQREMKLSLQRQHQEHQAGLMRKLAEATGIQARHIDCTFDNFRIDSTQDITAQGLAYNLTKQYAKNFKLVKEDGTSLLFTGTVGTGKNHLASAIINAILPMGYSARIVTASGLLRTLKDAFREGKTQESILADLVKVDLLVIDEVSAWSCLPEDAKTIFEIINRRSEAKNPSILIGNGSKEDLRKSFGLIAGPLFDRLREGGGRSIDFSWESYRVAKTARWLLDEVRPATVLSIAAGSSGTNQ